MINGSRFQTRRLLYPLSYVVMNLNVVGLLFLTKAAVSLFSLRHHGLYKAVGKRCEASFVINRKPACSSRPKAFQRLVDDFS